MEHFEQQKSQPILHQEINKKHGVPALISFFSGSGPTNKRTYR